MEKEAGEREQLGNWEVFEEGEGGLKERERILEMYEEAKDLQVGAGMPLGTMGYSHKKTGRQTKHKETVEALFFRPASCVSVKLCYPRHYLLLWA